MTTELPVSDLQAALETNTGTVLEYVQGLTAEQVNVRPANGGWTVLECFEHVTAIEIAVERMYRGKVATSERPADEKVHQIKRIFADRSRGYRSPEGFVPSGKFATLPQAAIAFADARSKLFSSGEELGWAELCISFPHPYFKELTRWEWAWFNVAHASRHLEQMKAVFKG